MTQLIDTHCHLDLEVFDEDREQVLARAKKTGVQGMVLIGFNPERWLSTEKLSNAHPGFVRAVGLHPNDARDWSDSLASTLAAEIRKPDVVAVGEIGLDYFRGSEDDDEQVLAFSQQLAIAAKLNLPVVIHQRSAEQQTIDLISEYASLSGVLHCFGGNTSYAMQCLELGFYLGIGGVITFQSAGEVREAVRATPIDKIVVETDAPFLAPTPWRGKRNEPAYICSVISTIAEIKGIPEDEVERRTTENAVRLFGKTLLKSIEENKESLA